MQNSVESYFSIVKSPISLEADTFWKSGLSVCLNAFAQFSRYEVQTSHTGQGLSGAGRGGVDDSTAPQGAWEWRVNHSKNVNSTCIRTVFKIKSWNFTGTSTTPRDRSRKGWRFYRFPTGVRSKGLITQNTWIRRAFAQFSRWRVETSQERRWLFGTGRGMVDVSTVPHRG